MESKIHSSNPTLERKGGRTEEREREQREEGAGGLGARQKEEERGEGVFMVPTQGSKIPLDLN